MKDFSQQWEELAQMQRKAFEPMQNLNAVAFNAVERVTRHNYAVLGDFVDYAVAQADIAKTSLTTDVTSPKGMVEAQMAQTEQFADKLRSRTAEYLELVGEVSALVAGSAQSVAEAASHSFVDTTAEGDAKAAKPAGGARRANKKAA